MALVLSGSMVSSAFLPETPPSPQCEPAGAESHDSYIIRVKAARASGCERRAGATGWRDCESTAAAFFPGYRLQFSAAFADVAL
jgi:hypothetical protein